MMLQNLHMHTTFSDGKNTAEEMVLRALAQGCTSLGFSDHSPLPWGTDNWATPAERMEEYRQEILMLKEKYAGKMDIFLGLEMDLDSNAFDGPWDYLIGSVHSVWSNGIYRSVDYSGAVTAETIRDYFCGDPYAYTGAYFQQVAAVAEKTKCQIIGHFDLVTKFNQQTPLFDETDPRYLTAALNALDELSKHDVIFEINTGAMSRGYRTDPYPSPTLLKAMRERNCRICITSDSHSVDTIFHAFDQAKELAKSCGYQESWVLTKHGFIPQEI